MNDTSPTAEDVFLSVRKSYRLLHDYQQMVIDAVRYIGRELDIPEWGAYSHFAAGDAVSGGNRELAYSSWAWLPMMHAAFHFTKQLPDTEWMSLSILVLSDTGFIEGDDGGKDKEDTTTFEDVGDSKTQFAFFVYRMHPHRFDTDLFGSGQLYNFLRTGSDLGTSIAGKLYNADCLCSESQLNAVIQDILNAARILNVPLDLRKTLLPV